VLLGYEYRTSASRHAFFTKAAQFFILERIPDNELHPAYIVDDIEMYRIKRKK
jgi:hypothetical protein